MLTNQVCSVLTSRGVLCQLQAVFDKVRHQIAPNEAEYLDWIIGFAEVSYLAGFRLVISLWGETSKS